MMTAGVGSIVVTVIALLYIARSLLSGNSPMSAGSWVGFLRIAKPAGRSSVSEVGGGTAPICRAEDVLIG